MTYGCFVEFPNDLSGLAPTKYLSDEFMSEVVGLYQEAQSVMAKVRVEGGEREGGGRRRKGGAREEKGREQGAREREEEEKLRTGRKGRKGGRREEEKGGKGGSRIRVEKGREVESKGQREIGGMKGSKEGGRMGGGKEGKESVRKRRCREARRITNFHATGYVSLLWCYSQVLEVDQERGRFLLSLRPSHLRLVHCLAGEEGEVRERLATRLQGVSGGEGCRPTGHGYCNRSDANGYS